MVFKDSFYRVQELLIPVSEIRKPSQETSTAVLGLRHRKEMHRQWRQCTNTSWSINTLGAACPGQAGVLGVLLDERLDMRQQCLLAAQRAKLILGCVTSSMGSRSRGKIPLLCSETPSEVLCPDLGSLPQEGHAPIGVQRRVMKLIRGMKHFCYEETLRRLQLFSLTFLFTYFF